MLFPQSTLTVGSGFNIVGCAQMPFVLCMVQLKTYYPSSQWLALVDLSVDWVMILRDSTAAYQE